MIALDYLNQVKKITDHYEKDMDSINKAAEIVANAIKNKKLIYFNGVGHANEQDFLNRAGGLASAKHFNYSFSVNADVPSSRTEGLAKDKKDLDLEAIRLAVKSSNMMAGDIMFMGSVSGKNRGPIELALACREIGMIVIGFTSLDYTKNVESLHPSGKKLCDVCDVVIDNGAPYGDAVCDCAGLDYKVLPISGVSMIIAGWLIMGAAAEKLGLEGNAPTMFMSVNRENGQAIYDNFVKQFNERGY